MSMKASRAWPLKKHDHDKRTVRVMAKGWRKGEYNRQLFGQKIRAYRLALQWSLGHLAQASHLNKGTLLHVEQGESSLPEAKRQALIDVLTEALPHIGQSVNYQELLQLAGLTAISSMLSSTLATTPSPAPDNVEASSQEKALSNKSHEEYAKFLTEQQEWQLSTTFWLLAAQEARYESDWAKWSRCLLNAGVMALTAGQFELAERKLKEVIEQAQEEVSAFATAEAYIRLGWLYYEQDKFREARHVLLKSGTLLQNLDPRSLHFPEHGGTLVYEGNEAKMMLEESRLHWLGRICIDWGIQQDNQALIEEGLAKLRQEGKYDRELALHGNIGFSLLRQIPALLYEGEISTSERYLAQSKELLDTRETTTAHISLHKGLLTLEEQPARARDFLEIARENFARPTLYPKGLAEACKEISGAYLMDDRKMGDEKAFQYAVVTTILHPYGRNIELLQLTAHKIYWRMGENRKAFQYFWRAVEEKVWRMEAEPFSDLRHLVTSFPESGIQQIEAALEKAKKAIHAELFEK